MKENYFIICECGSFIMQKGKLLSRGMTAEVFEWGEDKVLKLFFDNFDETWALNEANIGKAVFDAGIPSPEVFEIINVDNRKGIILERIFGNTMLDQVLVEPWKLQYFSIQLARLQYRIHKHKARGLPSQREKLAESIWSSSNILGRRVYRIIEYLYNLPGGSSVCHGDFHFGNVMVSGNKFIPIDWMNAYGGNPASDVARTCLIMTSPVVPENTPIVVVPLIQYSKWLTYSTYIFEYLRLSGISLNSVDDWILPMAAGKIKDIIPGEKTWLVNTIDMYLERL